MNAFNKLLEKLGVQENVSLASFCTLKAGGNARYLVFPHSAQELCELQKACLLYERPWHIISGGSNTLFSDKGFNGVVIKLGPAFDYIKLQAHKHAMTVGAASSFAKITKLALSRGWSHAVGWSGIPGLIGGALRMNAGTRFGEIKDAVLRIHGVLEGSLISYELKDLIFNYRNTNLPTNIIITHAELAYDKYLIRPVDELEKEVAIYRQKRKTTQPSAASAGSFFKNPYPNFAAALIENCNIKGWSYNNAQISALHANFIINNGGARAEDIMHVALMAQKAVWEKFGIKLQPEIKLIGDFGNNIFLD